MNVVIQNNEIVHIAIHTPQKLDMAGQDMAIAMLMQMLDMQYKDANVIFIRDRYGRVTDISIEFSDIEDATHFKLTHQWTEH